MNDLDKKDISTPFILIGFAFQGRETRDMVMHLEMSQS
jgi:hypothetical protein